MEIILKNKTKKQHNYQPCLFLSKKKREVNQGMQVERKVVVMVLVGGGVGWVGEVRFGFGLGVLIPSLPPRAEGWHGA